VLILRPIATRDLDSLLELAEMLDSMNLPRDRDFLEDRIAISIRSFSGDMESPRRGAYLFVLEDTESGRVIGTSSIMAKIGHPDTPYYWLAVTTEERQSSEVDRHFVHTKLQLQSTTDGPTEIGGLILDPAYRRHPEKCGKALSIVRFAFISMYPEKFESTVIAEMLSPFIAPGRNLLWDAFGAKFTGLPYREADHLSSRNKRFIADLFPQDPVYATLFSEEVQEIIGKINEGAEAAVSILKKLGFRYLHQVDPFDGGPYYGAARDAIGSVRERRQLVLPALADERVQSDDSPLALLSAEARLGYRATVVALDNHGMPIVSKEKREILGVASGDRVSVTPLP
jgi:arginine N-succinyltransferase